MNLRTALFALAPLLVATGCVTPADTSEDAPADSNSAAVVGNSASSQQVFQASSNATRSAVLESFRQQNGRSWNLGMFGLEAVDGYRNFLRGVWNEDGAGAPVVVTPEAATAKAVEFVRANAGFFGLTADELSGLARSVAVPPEGSIYHDDYRYFVKLSGTIVPARYEGFPEVHSRIDLDVGIHNDGEIRVVLQFDTVRQPELTLSTTPGLSANDARVVANVIGTELADYKRIGQSGFQTIYKKTALGPVSRANIESRKLMIFIDDGPDLEKRTLTLAYAVQVRMERDGQAYPFEFVVDAATGAVLYAPTAVPFGIIR